MAGRKRQQWCQTVGILVMALFVGNDLYLNATADFEDNTTPYISLISQILSIVLVLVLFLMLAIETHPCKVGLVKVSAARASARLTARFSSPARRLSRSRAVPYPRARALFRCFGGSRAWRQCGQALTSR